MKTYLVVTIMILSLFGKTVQATPEQDFWKWFQVNDAKLFDFEKDQERIFDQIGAALQKINPDLTFEFGPKKDGRREFVISAGGITKSFPAVESLYVAAPHLSRWTIMKFRQRRHPVNDIKYGNKEIKAKDVFYKIFMDSNPKKVGILVFMPGYKAEEEKTFSQVSYLMLDEALGEYDVETKVGAIIVEGQDSKHFPGSRPINDLGADFDAVMKARQ
jgi:hypothetical protein